MTVFSKLPNEVFEIILRQLKLKFLTRFASTNHEILARVREIIWDNDSMSSRASGHLTIQSAALATFSQEKFSIGTESILSENQQLEFYHTCMENNESPALGIPFSVGISFTPSKSLTLDGILLPTMSVEYIRVFNEEDLLRILRMILQTYW